MPIRKTFERQNVDANEIFREKMSIHKKETHFDARKHQRENAPSKKHLGELSRQGKHFMKNMVAFFSASVWHIQPSDHSLAFQKSSSDSCGRAWLYVRYNLAPWASPSHPDPSHIGNHGTHNPNHVPLHRWGSLFNFFLICIIYKQLVSLHSLVSYIIA